MDTDYDYLFKVVVIGDAGVGKTCVVKRYCDGGFSDTGIPTIGVDFSIKTLKVGTKTLKVNVYLFLFVCTMDFMPILPQGFASHFPTPKSMILYYVYGGFFMFRMYNQKSLKLYILSVCRTPM